MATTAPTDAVLLAAGDPDAFDRLYRRHAEDCSGSSPDARATRSSLRT